MSEERHHLDSHADLLATTLASRDPDELLSPEIVMQLIHIERSTLAGWRTKKIGPKYKRITPRMIRYPAGELLAWVRSRTQQTDRSPAPPPRVHVARRQQAAHARGPDTPPSPPQKQKLTAAPPAKRSVKLKQQPAAKPPPAKQSPPVKPVVRVKEAAR